MKWLAVGFFTGELDEEVVEGHVDDVLGRHALTEQLLDGLEQEGGLAHLPGTRDQHRPGGAGGSTTRRRSSPNAARRWAGRSAVRPPAHQGVSWRRTAIKSWGEASTVEVS